MKRLHAITLAAALGCLAFSAGQVHAGVYTVSVPAFEGVRYTYGDPELADIVDFGQPFSQIDRITVAITGTGHTGGMYMSTWNPSPPAGPMLTYFTLPAELLVSTQTEYWDGGKSKFGFFGAVGVFDETTPMTIEADEYFSSDTLRDGKAEFNVSANYIGTLDGLIGGGGTPDYAYVDIQTFTVTIEGEPFQYVSDADGDGFVGIGDLNIVLANWGRTVFPGDVLSGDLNGDGFVGIGDINWVLTDWNTGTPPAAASLVPEPATAAVLTLLAAASLTRRRQR